MTPPDPTRTAFLARPRTLKSVFADFPDWHLGRSPYLLWALDVDQPAIRQVAAAAAAHLAPYLVPGQAGGYVRQPHVTLALCGFPSTGPAHPDDFGPAQLAEQLRALATAAVAPFEVQVGGLASFALAPFLHVAGAALQPLRRSLHRPLPDFPDVPYVPHVTVGLYADDWPSRDVADRIDAFPAHPPVSCRIDRLSLMAYDPTCIGGRLESVAEYLLAEQALRWREQPFPGW